MSESFLAAAIARAADATVAALQDAFSVFDVSDQTAPQPSPPPPPLPQPPQHADLQRFANLIADAPPRSVIVLVGAGASVSAGIPDFRSPGTGLYHNLQKYNLPYAEAVFDIDYFNANPHPFYTLCKEMWPGQYEPTAAHMFFKALHEHGKLLRCFSQNIDSLESLAGLPEDMIVAAHGNFDRAHVVEPNEPTTADGSVRPELRRTVDVTELKAAIFEGEDGWKRLNARHGGLVKPAITFFGEELPTRFLQKLKSDFPRCEVLLVFGTSLMVQPFASLVARVHRGTPRLLINRERRGEELGLDFDSPGSTDGLFLGDCDAGARGLAAMLGWDLPRPPAAHARGPLDVSDGYTTAAVGDSPSANASGGGGGKVRLGLTRSETSKQAESVVLVEPTYDAIAKAAAHKLKLGAKAIKRLVLRTSVAGHPVGTELPTTGDCAGFVRNDALVWVATTSGGS